MQYFTQDFIDFFIELSENNNKEWFDENRKRYEKSVKAPFKQFTIDVIARLTAIEPNLAIEAKDAIFRINRDIRFSKDKTPYKTYLSAAIAPGGKKDYTYPGLYYELRSDGIGIYGGIWMTEKEDLYKVRSYIASNGEELNKAIKDKKFNDCYGGELKGDKNKVLPTEFKEIAKKYPLIFNKSWYYQCSLPASLITSEELVDTLIQYFMSAEKVRNFFIAALNH